MKSVDDRRAKVIRIVCWAIVSVTLANLGLHLSRGVFQRVNQFDDAYMFLRYAHNLLTGEGLVWNDGEAPVYGVTSLLHLIVVTVARANSSLRDSTLVTGSSAAASLAAALILVLVSSRCTRSPQIEPVAWAAMILPTLTLQEGFIFHALSGMDTMLALLFNSLLIGSALWYVKQPSRTRLALLVCAAYLAFLARPDNGIYAVMFPILVIWFLGTGSGRVRSICEFSLGIAAVLIVDAACKYAWLGDFVPLAYYAKQGAYFERYAGATHLNPFENLTIFYSAGLPYLVVVAMFGSRRDRVTIMVFWVPVLVTSAYYLTVVQVMGLYSRFYYPSIPFLVVSAALVLDRWWSEKRWPVGTSAITRILSAVFLVYLAPVCLNRVSGIYRDYFVEHIRAEFNHMYVIEAEIDLPVLGRGQAIDAMVHILRDAPPETSVALSEHGRIGAAAPDVTLVDVVGLHDREFAHHGFSVESLLERHPDMIWGPHPNYVGMVEVMLCSDSFWREYDYYPEVFAYGLALRKSSPRFAILRDRVESQWRHTYGKLRMEDYRARRSTETGRCTTNREPG